MNNKLKAVFFDRDGVVNLRVINDYIKNSREFKFLPDFLYFFPKVISSGYHTILITNQQGVSKGLMSLDELKEVFDFMQLSLQEKAGAVFDDIFYCTDPADTNSFYRKPNPGMILDAIKKWDIDTESSWVIGDSISDAQAGKRAGLKTVLVGKYKKENCTEADYIVKNLFEIEKNVPILL